jgi:hypothetical protein
MVEYGFRLRFELNPTTRINSEAEELEVLRLPSGERFRLRTGASGSPIKDHPRAALLGAPYRSSEEAKRAAENAKTALLYWAVEQRLGIDFGDDRPKGIATEAGLAILRQQFGVPFRNDVHGIDVYEKVPGLRFVTVDVTPTVGKNPSGLLETFGHELRLRRQLTDKQILASEIYSVSFFDTSPRSRFITLVTAIEALLEPAARESAVQELIQKMVASTQESTIDRQTKTAIIGSLQWLKAQSIGQAGRTLAAKLLPEKTYDGRMSSAFFRHCYDIRSQLVHSGKTKAAMDMVALANTTESFVADLLIASIRSFANANGPQEHIHNEQRWWLVRKVSRMGDKLSAAWKGLKAG